MSRAVIVKQKRIRVVATERHPVRPAGQIHDLIEVQAKVQSAKGFVVIYVEPTPEPEQPVTGDMHPRAIKIIKPEQSKPKTVTTSKRKK